MKSASLAFRNILRNRRRSLTTLLAMTLGVVTILLFGGYSRDIGYTLETGYIQRGGHLQIQRKDYFLFGSGNPMAYGIGNYGRLIDMLKADPVLGQMITVATPTLQFGGVAGNFASGLSRTVLVTGLEVDGQNRLHEWNDYDTFQKPRVSPLTGSPGESAFIGIGVARVLQLCEQLKVASCPKPPASDSKPPEIPQDIAALSSAEPPPAVAAGATRLELLAANTHGAPNVTALNVLKAEAQGTKELDDVYVAMHLAQAQRLLYGAASPKVTAVVVQLRHTSLLPAAKARLAEILQSPELTASGELLETRDFSEIYPFFGQANAMFQTIFGFIAILIGSIVLFTVGNTMGMAVVERTVEIGTLRAIGQRRSGIRRLFMLEGMFLGVIGAGFGVASALLIAFLINHSGLTWLPPGWANPVPFVVRVWGEVRLIGATALGIALVAVISAWWPARRAARLNVVEALRHV
jgi:putative ABC transport system permease protein